MRQIIIKHELYTEGDVIVISGEDQFDNIWKNEIGDLFAEGHKQFGINVKDGYLIIKFNKLSYIRQATKAERILWILETESKNCSIVQDIEYDKSKKNFAINREV